MQCWRTASSGPMEVIAHGGALPDLPSSRINLYRSPLAKGEPIDLLADLVRKAYGGIAIAA